MNKNDRVGVVGVGRMGANMARRLKDCGWQVAVVFDRERAVAAELAIELGGTAAASLEEVTAGADVVITVVSDDGAMREIFGLDGGGNGLLKGAAGRLFINCATVSPGVHEAVSLAAKAAGAAALEACMASSISQARNGTLYLMLGGPEEDVKRARLLLGDLSSTLVHVGGAGEAAKVKALVNMVMNANTAVLAEGLGLGVALGLDPSMLRGIFSMTGAASRVLETDGEDMEKRDHACYFSAAHAAKDSRIALDLAGAAGLSLPVSAAALGQYQKMVESGLGGLDKSGVAELTFPGRGPSAGSGK